MHGMERTSHALPATLLAIYIALFVVLAFGPVDRTVWFAENATVWLIVSPLVVLYVLDIRFSNTAYLLMSVLVYLHTIGGHYTFANVPFDWFTDFFGFERNHYDRIAHFTVGFYAYAIAEWLLVKRLVANRFLLITYPIFAIAMVAMTYEVVEWIAAATASSEVGTAYLGSQGDIWDAQKDMFLNVLGAIAAVVLFMLLHKLDKNICLKK
jgi:putative membrane protein